MDIYQIARDLIAIDSTTGREEGVVAYLERHLRGMGLEVDSQPVAAGRRNLIARLPGVSLPTVLFCTHTDTVPPYIPLREDDEFIRGRGACDTKGITACFLEAGRRLLEAGADDFGYLFVVDEEVSNQGAIAANRTVRAEYVVVGEPTENRLAIGHKGALGVEVSVEGRASHSPYPEAGDSAIHRLLGYLGQVLAADFGSDDLLGPATVNIGTIEGGEAHNVLAPSAKARVTIRVVDDIDEVERRFHACFTDAETGEVDRRVGFETFVRMPVPKLERLDGFETTVVSYGTDVPFLEDVGLPLLIGPGSILDAHSDHEKIAKADMDRAVEQYVEIAQRLIAGG